MSQIKLSQIRDEILHLDDFSKKQVWHFDDNALAFSGSKEASFSEELSFESSCYGQKKQGKAISFTFEREIQTKIKY